MDESVVRERLAELHKALESSALHARKSAPNQSFYAPVSSVHDCPLSESFDRVLLQLKYLLFDLEATRRENRYLREMLESRSRRDSDDTEDPA